MVIALFTAYDFSKGARENTPTTTETTDLGGSDDHGRGSVRCLTLNLKSQKT